MLIWLSHTPTTGSMLSNWINVGLPWQSMRLSEAICPTRRSLPEFQRLFPNEAAWATYLNDFAIIVCFIYSTQLLFVYYI